MEAWPAQPDGGWPDGRLLGVDYGTRRIGVAASDAGRVLAGPRTVVEAGPGAAAQIARLIVDEEAVGVVVGLPVALDGSDSSMTAAARAFAADLGEALRVPVVLHDERFSSTTAESALVEAQMRREARRRVVDKVAAAVMLQGYLDALRGGPGKQQGAS